MTLKPVKFEFIPHHINKMYQEFRHIDSFAKYLLLQSCNQKLWNLFRSIDPYSLSINRNNALDDLIFIISHLKHFVNIYTQNNQLNNFQKREINNYDVFMKYLYERKKMSR
jgi:hypothetical protein